MANAVNVEDFDFAAVLSAAQPFRPFAEYDQDMDCIRVQVRDCSITERRLGDLVTIYYETFPRGDRPRCIGLALKGVNAALKKAHIPHRAVYTVEMLADAWAKLLPVEQLDEFTEAVDQSGVRQVEIGVRMGEDCVAPA